MLFNYYTYMLIVKREHQERVQQAEQDHLIRGLLAWIKAQRDEDTPSWEDMQTPKLTISQN